MDFYDMPVGTVVVPLLIEHNFGFWGCHDDARKRGGDRVEPYQTCCQPNY